MEKILEISIAHFFCFKKVWIFQKFFNFNSKKSSILKQNFGLTKGNFVIFSNLISVGMGMSIGSLNPNGFPRPQLAPQPGMGIMAMMASAVPQPAALGGVLPPLTATPIPTVVDNVPLSPPPGSGLLVPSPMNGGGACAGGSPNLASGEDDPLLHNRRKSSSVSLIKVESENEKKCLE